MSKKSRSPNDAKPFILKGYILVLLQDDQKNSDEEILSLIPKQERDTVGTAVISARKILDKNLYVKWNQKRKFIKKLKV